MHQFENVTPGNIFENEVKCWMQTGWIQDQVLNI